MRKVILAAILAVVFYFIYSFGLKGSGVSILNSPTPSSVSQNKIGEVKGVSFENDNFNYNFVEVNPINIHLFSNLAEKLTAKDARIKNNCEYLTSAGFYTKEEKPIGLFISDYTKISSATNSTLFNGFFVIDANNNASISQNLPETNSKIALQSGPLLIMDKKTLSLNITNDEASRRLVLEKTTGDNLIFIVIFKKDNYSSGPFLKDLPDVLSLVNSDIKKDIQSAINLDGGSHSAFITNDASINEISTIGSYFCIR